MFPELLKKKIWSEKMATFPTKIKTIRTRNQVENAKFWSREKKSKNCENLQVVATLQKLLTETGILPRVELTDDEGNLEECREGEAVERPEHREDHVVGGEAGDDGDGHLHEQQAEEGRATAVSEGGGGKG